MRWGEATWSKERVAKVNAQMAVNPTGAVPPNPGSKGQHGPLLTFQDY